MEQCWWRLRMPNILVQRERRYQSSPSYSSRDGADLQSGFAELSKPKRKVGQISLSQSGPFSVTISPACSIASPTPRTPPSAANKQHFSNDHTVLLIVVDMNSKMGGEWSCWQFPFNDATMRYPSGSWIDWTAVLCQRKLFQESIELSHYSEAPPDEVSKTGHSNSPSESFGVTRHSYCPTQRTLHIDEHSLSACCVRIRNIITNIRTDRYPLTGIEPEIHTIGT